MILRHVASRRQRIMVLLAMLPLAVPSFSAAAQRPAAKSGAEGCPQITPDSAISVRLLQPVDSSKSKVGDTFAARLEAPLLTRGKTIAERGATARVRLVRLVQPKGSPALPALALQLADLTIGGRACPIVTGFAEVEAGRLRVKPWDMPEGVTSAEVILDSLTEHNPLEPAGATIVNGAGVSFAVVSGQSVKVPGEVVLRFRVADMLELNSRKTD